MIFASDYPSLSAAIGAASGNKTVILIPPGTYAVSSQISLASDIDLECYPNNLTTIQASAGFKTASGLFIANGVDHVSIRNCVFDGNYLRNSNQFPLLTVNNSLQIRIEGNHFHNNQIRLIAIAGSTDVTVEQNEFDFYGQPLPAGINNEGVAIAPGCTGCSSNGNLNVKVISNRFHDGVIAIGVYTTQSVSNQPSVGIEISHNDVRGMSHDGILVYSKGVTGSIMRGRIIGNYVRCTGWPGSSSGTWDSANCPPNYRQTGKTVTEDGVGFEMNAGLMDGWELVGNTSEYNWREGYDDTPLTFSIVTVRRGVNVTQNSGDPFDPRWVAGTPFLLATAAGGVCTIASVTDTSHLTINSCAGVTNTLQQAYGLGTDHNVFSGNIAAFNGNGNNGGSIAHGFASDAIGTIYNGNFSYSNHGNGFIDIGNGITHNGDHAFANNKGTAGQVGFADFAGVGNSYIAISTGDDSSQLQNRAISFGSLATSGRVETNSLCRYRDCTNSGILTNFGIATDINTNIPRQGNKIPLVAPLTTTSANSDNVTITGMTASGHCYLTATNSLAASNVATTYVSAKTTNRITVSHTAIAGMTYDILCTSY